MPTPHEIESSKSASDSASIQSSFASTLLSLTKTSSKGATSAAKTIIAAEGTSFICSYALDSLLMAIFSGEPAIAARVAKELAKYQVPAVAIPVAVIAALHQVKFGCKVPYRVVSAAMNGLGIASFSIPMVMELVTRIVQIIKHESRNTPVWITNGEAIGLIGGCSILGLAQALQTYFQQCNAAASALNDDGEALPLNAEDKSFLNRLTTSQAMVVLFAIMNSASAFHAGTFQLTTLLGYDTAGLVEYYTRLGITVTAGIAGGIILGRANPEKRVDAKIFNLLQNLIKLSTLGIGFTSLFYLSPNAKVVFGEEVINEQAWLWSVIIPSIPMIVLMLQLIGLKGPAVLQCLENIVKNIITCCRTNDSEEQPLLLHSSINGESPLLALSHFSGNRTEDHVNAEESSSAIYQ